MSQDYVLLHSQTLPDIRSFTDPSPPLPPPRPPPRPGVDEDSDPGLLHAHERGDLRLHLLLGHPLHGLVGVQVWRVILFGIYRDGKNGVLASVFVAFWLHRLFNQ